MAVTDLPQEIIQTITDFLTQKDIKQLRLVSKAFKERAPLRIKRIFISPHRINLDVFNNIVNHEDFKNDVEEIIWDDARLRYYAEGHRPESALEYDWQAMAEDLPPRPRYFEDYAQDAAIDDPTVYGAEGVMEWRKAELWGDRPRITMEESYEIYRRIYDEQEVIIESGEDVETLRLGLTSLPNLKRVTLTSEVWRICYLFPLYHTPMFRLLPAGFQMPLPWPWLGRGSHPNPEADDEIDQAQEEAIMTPWSDPHPEWRGYTILVTELLSTANEHNVTEFIIDVNREPTGISHQLFSSRSGDYSNTMQLFHSLPLTRLDLALNVQTAEYEDFDCLRNGLLKKALARLKHLQHFHLHTNLRTEDPIDENDESYWISLQDVLPTPHAKSWAKLQHIGLANLFTTQESLFELLSTLPALKSVDLTNITFRSGHSAYHSLLHTLRDKLVESTDGAWRRRKPRFIIREPSGGMDDMKRRTIDTEIDAFLYEGGACPFREAGGLEDWAGWIVDDFNDGRRIRYSEVQWVREEETVPDEVEA